MDPHARNHAGHARNRLEYDSAVPITFGEECVSKKPKKRCLASCKKSDTESIGLATYLMVVRVGYRVRMKLK